MKYPFLATVWASLHRGYTLQSCSILGDLWYTQEVWPSASLVLPGLPDNPVTCSVLFNSPSNLGHTQFLHLLMILGTLSKLTLYLLPIILSSLWQPWVFAANSYQKKLRYVVVFVCFLFHNSTWWSNCLIHQEHWWTSVSVPITIFCQCVSQYIQLTNLWDVDSFSGDLSVLILWILRDLYNDNYCFCFLFNLCVSPVITTVLIPTSMKELYGLSIKLQYLIT